MELSLQDLGSAACANSSGRTPSPVPRRRRSQADDGGNDGDQQQQPKIFAQQRRRDAAGTMSRCAATAPRGAVLASEHRHVAAARQFDDERIVASARSRNIAQARGAAGQPPPARWGRLADRNRASRPSASVAIGIGLDAIAAAGQQSRSTTKRRKLRKLRRFRQAEAWRQRGSVRRGCPHRSDLHRCRSSNVIAQHFMSQPRNCHVFGTLVVATRLDRADCIYMACYRALRCAKSASIAPVKS